MKVLVLGASGATGSLVVQQLIDRGFSVRLLVRPTSYLDESIVKSSQVEVVRAHLLKSTDSEWMDLFMAATL